MARNRILRRLRYGFERTKMRFFRYRWARLAVRVIDELGKGHASDMAASLAYFTTLSLFPLLLGIIAFLGLFLPSETVQKALFDFFNENLPGATSIVVENIAAVIRLRGALGLLSLIGLFWSGSGIFGTISRIVNHAWGIPHDRPFLLRRIRDLALALVTSLLFFTTLGATTVSALLPQVSLPLSRLLTQLLGFLLEFTAFLLIYKFMPNARVAWRYVWPGALLASALFEAARSLFIFYLDRFASYVLVYGALASLIAFLVWVYFSAFFLVLGAEFASEYAKMRTRERFFSET